MLTILGRIWVTSRRDGILATDLPIAAHGREFSPALVPQHALGFLQRFLLRLMAAGGFARVVSLVLPFPVIAAEDGSVLVLAHIHSVVGFRRSWESLASPEACHPKPVKIVSGSPTNAIQSIHKSTYGQFLKKHHKMHGV
jgi:hypothetical protein